MKKELATLLLGVPFLLGNNCGPSDSGGPPISYGDPCGETIYTSEEELGVGNYKLGIGDTHEPVNSWGFRYVDGNKGGIGNTLEMYGCGINMLWLGGGLYEVSVSGGHYNRIEPGLFLKTSTRDDFLDVFPDSIEGIQLQGGLDCLIDDHVKAYFYERTGHIAELRLSEHKWEDHYSRGLDCD